MTKKTNKILLSLILFLTIFLLKSTNVFATDIQEKAFNEFVNKKYQETYNLYLGEKMYVASWESRLFLNPSIKISDLSVVGAETQSQIKAKKVGKTKVTVEILYNGRTATKEFYVNVIKTDENTKLDSNKNDILSITQLSGDKTNILLANSELWNTKKNTFKISKKETGNVAKYVYSSVYYSKGQNTIYAVENVLSTLKNNGELTVENKTGKKTISNVKEASRYGYLTQNGKFYMYTVENNQLKIEKKAEGVSNLVGDRMYVKNGKTYMIMGEKVFDFVIVQEKDGLALAKNGVLYYLGYDYNKNKEVTVKVDTKVEKLLGNFVYKKKSGETKKYIINSAWQDNKKAIKEIYAYSNGENKLRLMSNNKLYLNDVQILDKVENVESVYTDKYEETILIVRKDGSIWRLRLNGKAQLTKIRNGKEEYKKISAPKNITAVKSGENNVKIKWEKVDGATKYTVYRATSKNGKYSEIGTTKTNSYKDKGIEIGKTYYYKVVANYSDSSLDSEKSSAVQIKIPKMPTKVTATKKSKTSFKVSYKSVSGIYGYEIEYATNKKFENSIIKDTKKTSRTIDGLKKNKTYYVRVRAYKIINGQKIYSSYTGVQKVVLK